MRLSLKKRQERILDLLAKTPVVSTRDLSEKTGVSTETIRKDLDTLYKEKKIIKVHGGAALSNPDPGVSPFDTRKSINTIQKAKIAKGAISLINKGDSIILESSTTCLELSKSLVDNPDLLSTLIIITNSFEIANLFEGGKLCEKLFFLGGWTVSNEYCTKGFHTTQLLEYWNSDKAFISAAAIENDYNVTSFLEDDMLFQRYAMQSAEETVLLADKTKFERSASYAVSPLKNFAYIVTDLDKDSDTALELQNLKHHLVIVECQA